MEAPIAKVYLLHRFSGKLIADEVDIPGTMFAHGAVANYVRYGAQLLLYPAHYTLESGTAVVADSPDGRMIATALEKGKGLPLVGTPLPGGKLSDEN